MAARRSSDEMYTSSFVDDVMLSHNGANGPEPTTIEACVNFVEFPGGSTGSKVAIYDCIGLLRMCFLSVFSHECPALD